MRLRIELALLIVVNCSAANIRCGRQLSSLFSSSATEYTGSVNAACRLSNAVEGQEGVNFDVIRGISLQQCIAECTSKYSCKGYEYDKTTPTTCQLWKHFAPSRSDFSSNLHCFFKLQDCCPPRDHNCNADEYDPVICGASKCLFDNLCLAKAANFLDVECTRSCPNKPTACTDEPWDPVTCTSEELSCVYDNACAATESGWLNANTTCSLTCPPEGSGSCSPACTREYDPHICGKAKCEYSNQCTATDGAGFAVEQCYRKYPFKEEERTSNSNSTNMTGGGH